MDAPESSRNPGERTVGLRRPTRRAAVRIDMTPMVDVAFLLLIFFMVTTVFRQPLALEVNLPEPGAKVEVPQSNVLTVAITAEDAMYSKMGTGAFAPVGWDALIPLFRREVEANPDLIVLVKIHGDARYERMVDMMDTLEEAHMERFSLVRLSEEDAAELEGAR